MMLAHCTNFVLLNFGFLLYFMRTRSLNLFQITGSTPSRYRIGEMELNSTIIPIPDKKVQHFYSSNILSKIEDNKKQNIIFKDDFGTIENDHIIKILK